MLDPRSFCDNGLLFYIFLGTLPTQSALRQIVGPFCSGTVNMTLDVDRTCAWRVLQVFDTGVVLADGEFSQLESAIIGAPLAMTNNYMKAVAYNEVRAQAPGLLKYVCRVGVGLVSAPMALWRVPTLSTRRLRTLCKDPRAAAQVLARLANWCFLFSSFTLVHGRFCSASKLQLN